MVNKFRIGSHFLFVLVERVYKISVGNHNIVCKGFYDQRRAAPYPSQQQE